MITIEERVNNLEKIMIAAMEGMQICLEGTVYSKNCLIEFSRELKNKDEILDKLNEWIELAVDKFNKLEARLNEGGK